MEGKLTPKRIRFNEQHMEFNEKGIQKEILYTPKLMNEKL